MGVLFKEVCVMGNLFWEVLDWFGGGKLVVWDVLGYYWTGIGW